jgi:hypothetical protein
MLILCWSLLIVQCIFDIPNVSGVDAIVTSFSKENCYIMGNADVDSL